MRVLEQNDEYKDFFHYINDIELYTEEEIQYKKVKEKGEYSFIIKSRVPNFFNSKFNLYKAFKYSRGYGQSKLRMILVDKKVNLFVDMPYKSKCWSSKITFGGQEYYGDYYILEEISLNTKIQFSSNYINMEMLSISNNFNKENPLPIFKYLIYKKREGELYNDKYFKEIVKVINDSITKYKLTDKLILDSFLFLKFKHKDKFESSRLEYNPMQFEFWTKQPNNANFSFYEKEIIELILKEIEDFKLSKFFHSKANAFLKNKLKNENSYIYNNDKLDYEKIKENEKFIDEHDEYKLVKVNDSSYIFKEFETIKNWLNNFMEKREIITLNDEEKTLLNSKELKCNEIIKSKNSLILGPPGSGKTKLIKETVLKLNSLGEKTIFLGPTWRAALIFGNEIEITASTVQNYFGKNKWYYKFMEIADKYDNLIIDEISMIEDKQWNLISKWVKENFKRVILSGDECQLSPINSVGILKHIDLNGDNVIKLKETTRQEGKLKAFVENYLKEGKFVVKGISNDVIKSYNSAVDLYENLMVFNDFKIITPINEGPYGKSVLNNILNNRSEYDFNIGDRVVVNETSSSDLLKKIIYQTKELIIQSISDDEIIFNEKPKGHHRYTEFSKDETLTWEWEEGGFLKYKILDWREYWTFAINSAITTHYSQGATLEKVIYIIPKDYESTKENIYTAISRVKGSEMKNLKIFIHSDDIHKYT